MCHDDTIGDQLGLGHSAHVISWRILQQPCFAGCQCFTDEEAETPRREAAWARVQSRDQPGMQMIMAIGTGVQADL